MNCPFAHRKRERVKHVVLIDSFMKAVGEPDRHKDSTREYHTRCAAHRSGLVGLYEDGQYGSCGPSRKQLPKDDAQVLPALMGVVGDAMKRPQLPGGFYDSQKSAKTNIMCSV